MSVLQLSPGGGSAAASRIGLLETRRGAAILTAGTGLPAQSAGPTSTPQVDDERAFPDVGGGNAPVPVSFLLAWRVCAKAVVTACRIGVLRPAVRSS